MTPAGKTYRLTSWGNFVARHTALTPPEFWTDLNREIDEMADEDADYDVALSERIAGLTEYQQCRRTHGGVENWPSSVPSAKENVS